MPRMAMAGHVCMWGIYMSGWCVCVPADLLTVDYQRWASGLARNTPAGSLVAQAQAHKPTTAGAAAGDAGSAPAAASV